MMMIVKDTFQILSIKSQILQLCSQEDRKVYKTGLSALRGIYLAL